MLSEGFTKLLIGLGTLAIIVGFIMFCLNDSLFQFDEQIKSDKIGQLGDFVGGVAGSIWALAGVILFYLAFQSQKDALDDQKLATKATIEAVKKQNDALKLQTEEIALQREEMSKSTEAQNKSQLALNNQLKSMQLTSQIDVLNQYLGLIKNKGKDEHEKVSKEIITHLTNQIFYNPEYADFIKPNYSVQSKQIAKIGTKGEKYNHTIRLKVTNNGTENVKLINTELQEAIHYTNKTGRTSENAIYEFKFAAEKADRSFLLEYDGRVVPNKYRQIVRVNGDDVTISEVEIIETVYDS